MISRDFPASPLVKTWSFHSARDMGSIPAQGTKILHAMGNGQKKKKFPYKIISLNNKLFHFLLFTLSKNVIV